MKITFRLFVAVLFLIGLLLAVFLARNSNRKPTVRLLVTPHEQEAVDSVPVAVSETAGKSLTTNESLVTAPGIVTAGRETLQTSAVPTEITLPPRPLSVESPALLPLVGTVSKAVLSVDGILKTGDYRVHEFSRSIWLTSEDKAHSIVWTIFPCGTNAVVGSIEATAYQDATLTQKDPSQSFQMQFDPESGALLNFSWADKHEVLVVQTNDWSVDYARHLDGKKRLVMRWDEKGTLVSSNVYDWATRGRVIGGSSRSNKTSYPLGPTSSVEAATESWRRKGE